MDEGKLEQVRKGLYILSEGLADEYALLQAQSAKAVFSYGTALFLWELSDRTPHFLDITLPHGTNISRLKRDNPNLTIVIGFVTKEEKPYYRSEEAGDKTLVFHKKFGNRDIMDTDNIVLLYAKIYQHGKLIDVKEMPRRRMEYLRSLSPNSESAYSPWKQHLYAMWQAKLMRESLKFKDSRIFCY